MSLKFKILVALAFAAVAAQAAFGAEATRPNNVVLFVPDGLTIYVGRPLQIAHDSVTPFVENNQILGEMDRLFDGDCVNEETQPACVRC
jgi:hypothetical protein